MKDNHRKEQEKIECIICHKKYPTGKDLRKHQRRVHDGMSMKNKYQCSYCEKEFYLPSRLQAHIEFAHIEQKRLKCNICGRGFMEKDSLQDHMNVIHNETKDKKYKCDVCPKEYHYRGAFIIHKKIHFPLWITKNNNT